MNWLVFAGVFVGFPLLVLAFLTAGTVYGKVVDVVERRFGSAMAVVVSILPLMLIVSVTFGVAFA